MWGAIIPGALTLINTLKGNSSANAESPGSASAASPEKSKSGVDWLGLGKIATGLFGGIGDRQDRNAQNDYRNRELAERMRQFDANLGLSNQELAERMRQFNATLGNQQRQFDATFGHQQAQAGLASTQMNPATQAMLRGRNELVAQLLAGASNPVLSGDRFTGGFTYGPAQAAAVAPFISQAARTAEEDRFKDFVNAVSGRGAYARAATPATPVVPRTDTPVSGVTTSMPRMVDIRERPRYLAEGILQN